MAGNGLLLASHSDLWADGPDFSGSNVPSKGPGPPCRLRTSLSGAEQGHFEQTLPTSDYLLITGIHRFTSKYFKLGSSLERALFGHLRFRFFKKR